MKKITAPPKNIEQLQARCQDITGLTITELANRLDINLPANIISSKKGIVGQMLEHILGANASSKPQPDFIDLNIELKTIPVCTTNNQLQPTESTYVCTVMADLKNLDWQSSWVRRKLSHVLWIPIQADKTIPFKNRKILQPIFWQPSHQDNLILQQDWEELMEMAQLGELETLSAKYGQYLHIRPKAANSRVLATAININGEIIKTVPKGFYLRTLFTKEIIHYHTAN